jgi:hypothetical protein
MIRKKLGRLKIITMASCNVKVQKTHKNWSTKPAGKAWGDL